MRAAPRWILWTTSLIWVTGTVGATFLMNEYAMTPGASAQAQPIWPAKTRVPKGNGQDLMLVFVHPRCSCSRATLSELERMLPAIRSRFEIVVVFEVPKNKDAAWYENQESWQKVNRMNGIRVFVDAQSEETERFGVRTSGQVLLFASDGRLLFSGGITPSRGHSGDSAGRAALLAYAGTSRLPWKRTPVFGCGMGNEYARN